MTIPQTVKQCLEQGGVTYSTHRHRPTFTATEVAAAQHLPDKQVAKTVIVTLDDSYAMVVLPAPYHVDFDALTRATGACESCLVQEGELRGLFSGVETGAWPPFGVLWDMPVFVDRTLEDDVTITFNGGTHVDSITMLYAEVKRMVKPVVIDCAAET